MLTSFLAAAAVGASPAEPASPTAPLICNVITMDHTVIVSGLRAGSSGRMCFVADGKRDCMTGTADANGFISHEAAGSLDGPVWFAASIAKGGVAGSSCSALPGSPRDEKGALFLTLVSVIAAFVTGMLAALLPKWIERGENSREAANEWLQAFEAQLRAFRRDAGADPLPPPLPMLGKKEAKRLVPIVTLAEAEIAAMGYTPAASEAGRRKVVDKILIALRDAIV